MIKSFADIFIIRYILTYFSKKYINNVIKLQKETNYFTDFDQYFKTDVLFLLLLTLTRISTPDSSILKEKRKMSRHQK